MPLVEAVVLISGGKEPLITDSVLRSSKKLNSAAAVDVASSQSASATEHPSSLWAACTHSKGMGRPRGHREKNSSV